MTRAEALACFRMDCCRKQEVLHQMLIQRLPEKMTELMEGIYASLERIAEQAQERGKTDRMYFLFGLQRYDLKKNRATVQLDVTGMACYLEEDPLTTQLDITFLFQDYFDWQEKLYQEIKKYQGKVQREDVEALVQEEIMAGNRLLPGILRLAFRNLEEQTCFQQIDKLPFFLIRWGEWREESEIVLRVDRSRRKPEVWQEKLAKYQKDSGILEAGHWYQMHLSGGDCQRKQMYFTTFEDCVLEGIDFSQAGLWGARFLRCHLRGCNFTGADLRQAEFADCQWEENQFLSADLEQAVFSEEGFPLEAFEESQLKVLFVSGS